MKRVLALLFIIILMGSCLADEEYPLLYSMSKSLQGRIRPGKKYEALVSFDLWTRLHPTGRVSDDRMWVEVRSDEGDLVWCNANYLTETINVLHVYTLWDEGVKIRSKPGNGKVTGTARKEQVLEITNVVMGYGKCEKGWVDMDYFIIDCD